MKSEVVMMAMGDGGDDDGWGWEVSNECSYMPRVKERRSGEKEGNFKKRAALIKECLFCLP